MWGAKLQEISPLCRIVHSPLHLRKEKLHSALRSYTTNARIKRALYAPRATQNDSDSSDDDTPVDIDALARQLSQEADRLRRSESGKEASTSQPEASISQSEDPIHASDDPIFGAKVACRPC